MAAALQYQVETGSPIYVNEFLKTGTWETKAPSGPMYDYSVKNVFEKTD